MPTVEMTIMIVSTVLSSSCLQGNPLVDLRDHDGERGHSDENEHNDVKLKGGSFRCVQVSPSHSGNRVYTEKQAILNSPVRLFQKENSSEQNKDNHEANAEAG